MAGRGGGRGIAPTSAPLLFLPQSIRLMLNKDSRWSRAIKYLLADLKACAAWSAAARARALDVGGGGAAAG